MGYREDGNFNITWQNDGLSTGTYAKENADFLFPDKSIRFLQAQAALDASQNKRSVITAGDWRLHRGYIRNLEQPAFGDTPISRCNFQFNPQQIQQTVGMREDVYIPILQAPSQLAQPLGANVNFTFDLFFDRSHELAKGTSPTAFDTPGVVEAADATSIGTNDAYDIGVLADLRVFYSVIGQGFSKEMVDFQQKMFKYNADAALAASAGMDMSDLTAPKANSSDIQSLIDSNIGNFALLMPMPVRIMFSSLFMVDGFVTGTTVDFLKFSTKMVPVQCRIGVTMNALYIGFAREKTYLTDVFEKAAVAAAATAAANAELRNELLSALKISCSSFLIGAAYGGSISSVSWDDAASLSHNSPLALWHLANDNRDDVKALYFGFPNIIPNRGGDWTVSQGGAPVTLVEGADYDYILGLYEAGAAINFSYTWGINVWGRIPGPTNLPYLTQAEATRYMNGDVSDTSIKLLGSYSGTETSASKDDWGSGTSGDGVKAERVRRRSLRATEVVNSADDAYFLTSRVYQGANNPIATLPNVAWGTGSYFIIEITVEASASSGGSEPWTVSYSSKEVKRGDSTFARKVGFNWEGLELGDLNLSF